MKQDLGETCGNSVWDIDKLEHPKKENCGQEASEVIKHPSLNEAWAQNRYCASQGC